MVDTEIYGCDYSSTGFITSEGDVGCVTGLDNVAQQVHNRLMTRLGTYPTIDTDYGSEVYLVLGEKSNSQLMNELDVYIRNCMLEEPRVYEVIDLEITKTANDTIRFDLLIRLVDGSELGLTEEINTLG